VDSRTTAGDPLVDEYDRLGVELDLATLYVLEGASDDALDVLQRIPRARIGGKWRRAVHPRRRGAGRRPHRAVARRAREATAVDPHALLPGADRDAAGVVARRSVGRARDLARILSETEQSQSLSTLLVAMRARIELERARRADAKAHAEHRALRALVQRVRRASVRVDGAVVGECGRGLLVLLACSRAMASARRGAWPSASLSCACPRRARPHDRSALEERLALWSSVQFTLAADTARGRRPSFDPAAEPAAAEALYARFVAHLAELG
jgi:D-tyrosyl-tRNA(Tyr) deacylase